MFQFKRQLRFTQPKVWKPRYPRWRVINTILIVVLGVTSVYFFLRSDLFVVKHIEVITANSSAVPVSKIEQIGAKYISHPIFGINAKEIESEILSGLLAVKTTRVNKQLPNTLKIEYTERQRVLVLIVGQNKYLVDESGLIFAPTDIADNLPQVSIGLDQMTVEQNEILGHTLKQNEIQVMVQVAAFPWSKLHVNLKGLEHQAGNLILVFEDWQATISQEKGLDLQLRNLAAIIKHADSEGKQLASVDLRFARPVVRYR